MNNNYNYNTASNDTDGSYGTYYTYDPNNNYHIDIPYNSDNSEDYYICGYYYYDWKENMIHRLKKIIEELVNIPPIKIPVWIYENLDLLKELGIKVKEKKEEDKDVRKQRY